MSSIITLTKLGKAAHKISFRYFSTTNSLSWYDLRSPGNRPYPPPLNKGVRSEEYYQLNQYEQHRFSRFENPYAFMLYGTTALCALLSYLFYLSITWRKESYYRMENRLSSDSPSPPLPDKLPVIKSP